jgi:hypothetical protein
MTDMTTARAFPSRHYPGQGRSLSTFNVNPVVDTLIAIPFDTAGEFDSVTVLAKLGGSHDAVVRGGLYDSDSTGLPGSLIEDAGEYSISTTNAGQKDMLLSAPIALSLPFWAVILFGGTTMPQMLGSAAIPTAEMQRIFGVPGNALVSGIYNVALNNAVTAAFPYAALPATFPTPTLSGSTVWVSVRSTM